MKKSVSVSLSGVLGLCGGLVVAVACSRALAIGDPWTPFVVGSGGGLGYVLVDGIRRRRSRSNRKTLR